MGINVILVLFFPHIKLLVFIMKGRISQNFIGHSLIPTGASKVNYYKIAFELTPPVRLGLTLNYKSPQALLGGPNTRRLGRTKTPDPTAGHIKLKLNSNPWAALTCRRQRRRCALAAAVPRLVPPDGLHLLQDALLARSEVVRGRQRQRRVVHRHDGQGGF